MCKVFYRARNNCDKDDRTQLYRKQADTHLLPRTNHVSREYIGILLVNQTTWW